VLWTLGAVVLFPDALDPWVAQSGPFTRLAGTWIALAAAVMTALGLLAIAVQARRAYHERRGSNAPERESTARIPATKRTVVKDPNRRRPLKKWL
jgi:hypothetical protein